MGGGSIIPAAGDQAFDDGCDLFSEEHLYPNKLETGTCAEEMVEVAYAVEHLCRALQETTVDDSGKVLYRMPSAPLARQSTLQLGDARTNSQAFLDYLDHQKKRKLDELHKVCADIQLIDEDTMAVRKYQKELRTRTDHLAPEDLPSWVTTLWGKSQLEVVAEVNGKAFSQHGCIIASMDFDGDENLLAVAGPSKRITVLDFSSVMGAEAAEDSLAVAEISNGAKISCLSWNKSERSHIATSDYEGHVTIWDVTTLERAMTFEEHGKRVWSVDFSRTEPSLLVSGSDDCTVKTWSATQRSSILSIKMKANVCSVKYDPSSSIHLAVGSADHAVYYYDLRNVSHPIHVFHGHGKSVSSVEFLSASSLISASTDSTLRLWDLETCLPLREFRGHVNTRNFIGLSASNGGYIICGSETDEVFLYHKDNSLPIAWHSFSTPFRGDDDSDEHNTCPDFVSTVHWKGDGTRMVAGNSRGMIRVLSLDQ